MKGVEKGATDRQAFIQLQDNIIAVGRNTLDNDGLARERESIHGESREKQHP
jgi:hypothetical protein